jgi:hypothetical protein
MHWEKDWFALPAKLWREAFGAQTDHLSLMTKFSQGVTTKN